MRVSDFVPLLIKGWIYSPAMILMLALVENVGIVDGKTSVIDEELLEEIDNC